VKAGKSRIFQILAVGKTGAVHPRISKMEGLVLRDKPGLIIKRNTWNAISRVAGKSPESVFRVCFFFAFFDLY